MHPNTGVSDKVVNAWGLLSIASGALLVAAPETMARVYALPPQRNLLRLIGARDLAIGGSMLYPRSRRAANVARLLSDVVDATLIIAQARRSGRSVSDVRGRVLAGLISATIAYLAQRSARTRA